MQAASKWAACASILASLVLASPALGSGGVNSGGVNSGGVNSGGGGGGGGSTTTAAAPQISSFSASAGYRPGGFDIGAVWVNYSVKNGWGVPAGVTATLSEQNLSTGNVEWGYSDYRLPLDPNGSYSSGTLDNDNTPLATSYLVTLTIKDAATGQVLDTRSSTVTTGKLRAG